jgi:glycosyltransferase involved in cell wall biosynthesis
MKTAVVLLDYLRHTFTDQCLQSFHRGNHPFDLFQIDRLGIAAALNEGIDKTKDYDAVAFCGNDILMPGNWLAMAVQHIDTIPDTGMCGIFCVESLPPLETINGLQVHSQSVIFGNVVIPRKAIDAVGYFNEAFDPYGMQDTDYSYRLTQLGFKNYYMQGLQSQHLGHDVGEQTDYRKMKDEGLNKAADVWGKYTKMYMETNNYTIFEKQF